VNLKPSPINRFSGTVTESQSQSCRFGEGTNFIEAGLDLEIDCFCLRLSMGSDEWREQQKEK